MYDSPLMVAASKIASCLCAKVAESGLPGLCFCGIYPGDQVALDYVDSCEDACGMGWVKVGAIAPISGIGQPNINVGNCGSAIGADLEVGIARCVPVGEAEGEAPSEADLLTSADLQIADAMAMYQAIVCCEGAEDFIVETYTPFGPDGGAVGGFWTLSIGL